MPCPWRLRARCRRLSPRLRCKPTGPSAEWDDGIKLGLQKDDGFAGVYRSMEEECRTPGMGNMWSTKAKLDEMKAPRRSRHGVPLCSGPGRSASGGTGV